MGRRMRIGFRTMVVYALLVMLLFSAMPARAVWLFGQDGNTTVTDPVPEDVMALPVLEKTVNTDIRVYLKSLSTMETLTLKVHGSYTTGGLNPITFGEGATVAISAVNGVLRIQTQGITINSLGAELNLYRDNMSKDTVTGVEIEETERQNIYCGDLYFVNQNGVVLCIVTSDMEDYLYGVVPYEMSNSFPLEALKAQAVAARSYAMTRKNNNRSYDVTDTTDDQVYRGMDPTATQCIQAVDETKNVVGQYKGNYVLGFFTASNGGMTENPEHIWGGSGDYGYLEERYDPYDLENPDSIVKSVVIPKDPKQMSNDMLTILKKAAARQLANQGFSDKADDVIIESLETLEARNPRFEKCGMYTTLRFGLGLTAKRYTIYDDNSNVKQLDQGYSVTMRDLTYVDVNFYDEIKKQLGLKINGLDCEIVKVTPMKDGSTIFDSDEADSFLVETRRFGHGVGMSQRGAQTMAKTYGKTWIEILSFYYPGMMLARMKAEPKVNRAQLSVQMAKEALEKAQNAPEGETQEAAAADSNNVNVLQEGEQYATVHLESQGSSLNVRAEPDKSAAIVGTVPNGSTVIVVSYPADGWAKIRTALLKGYCSTDFLLIQQQQQ